MPNQDELRVYAAIALGYLTVMSICTKLSMPSDKVGLALSSLLADNRITQVSSIPAYITTKTTGATSSQMPQAGR